MTTHQYATAPGHTATHIGGGFTRAAPSWGLLQHSLGHALPPSPARPTASCGRRRRRPAAAAPPPLWPSSHPTRERAARGTGVGCFPSRFPPPHKVSTNGAPAPSGAPRRPPRAPRAGARRGARPPPAGVSVGRGCWLDKHRAPAVGRRADPRHARAPPRGPAVGPTPADKNRLTRRSAHPPLRPRLAGSVPCRRRRRRRRRRRSPQGARRHQGQLGAPRAAAVGPVDRRPRGRCGAGGGTASPPPPAVVATRRRPRGGACHGRRDGRGGRPAADARPRPVRSATDGAPSAVG